jgi:cyclic pyranopterin phosphate synthase
LPEDVPVHGAEGLPDALGALFATARVAGVQASKKTAGLIPLCHPLTGSGVDVRIVAVPEGMSIEAEATTIGPTGVEMEALTACAFAALSALSLLRDSDQRVSIDDLMLWEKSGGRSGAWTRAT